LEQCVKYRKLTEATLNSDNDPPVLTGEDIEEVAPGTDFEKGLPGLGCYSETEEENTERDA